MIIGFRNLLKETSIRKKNKQLINVLGKILIRFLSTLEFLLNQKLRFYTFQSWKKNMNKVSFGLLNILFYQS